MSDTDNDFLYIKEYKNDIDNIISSIGVKINSLGLIYKEYLKSVNLTDDYLSSLDTLNYQELLLVTDLKNYNVLYNLFLNKTYCQYFKLYQRICKFITEINTKELNIILNRKFTVYKDLDNNIKYNFSETEDIIRQLMIF